jgi:hypothetical protein
LRWSTFLRLHAQGIIACDFLLVVDGHVPTALRVRGDRAPQPTSDPLQRHHPSRRRMDAATAARDHRVPEDLLHVDSGQRQNRTTGTRIFSPLVRRPRSAPWVLHARNVVSGG